MTDFNKPRITITIVAGGDTDEFDIIKLMGDLDKIGLDSVRAQIDEEIEKSTKKYLIMNFEELNFINSESIGYLLTLFYRLTKKNAKLIIMGAPDKILDVLEVIGMLKVIEHFPTMRAFKESIEKG